MGTLFVIATPIGNLDDVTVRTLSTLRGLDLLLAEDTRVTRRLLDRYDITVKMESYREEVHGRVLPKAAELLRQGAKIGLASDAGTPGIADPGARLVRDLVALIPDLIVIPIPGPSAVAAALSVAGLPADEFLFLGFPPHKKGRAGFFKDALASERTVVFYESPHRVEKALAAVAEADPGRKLVVCRELTKIYETCYRGAAGEILAELLKTNAVRGEFVIVIEGMRSRKSTAFI